MKLVLVTLKSTSPYSQSRMHDTPKLEKESHEAYELRTWREKCTANDAGEICIAATALKKSLDTAAQLLGRKVPERRGKTFKDFFKSGVVCQENVPLGVLKSEVAAVDVNCHVDGNSNSGKRVKRRFPLVPEWSGLATFVIYDDTVTPDEFKKHLEAAGRFVGIGRWRPQNGGLNGRFVATSFEFGDL